MHPDCHQYSLRRQQVPENAAAAPPVIDIAANDVSLSPLVGTEVCIPVSAPTDGTQTRNSKRRNEESMVFGDDLSECTFSPQKKNKPATTCTSSQDLPARGITCEAAPSEAPGEDISKEEPCSETQNKQGATIQEDRDDFLSATLLYKCDSDNDDDEPSTAAGCTFPPVAGGAPGEAHFHPLDPRFAHSDPREAPPLGSTYWYPVDQAIENLLHVTDVDKALLKLWEMLHDAGLPLGLIDKVVAFIEKHCASTFKDAIHLDRRGTLFKRMS